MKHIMKILSALIMILILNLIFTVNGVAEESRITTNTKDQLYPSIYGTRIVWEDYRNGNSDIYMYDLSV